MSASKTYTIGDLRAAVQAAIKEGAKENDGAKEIVVNWIPSKAKAIITRNNKVHCMMDWGDGEVLSPLTVEKTPGVDEWFWCDPGAAAVGLPVRRRFSDKDFMFWEFEVPAPLRQAINALL